ncbi:MAG: KTSC domain-containing protein [Pseudomonadota bacterium]|nr:KTSC domain-containing protein [Pseudomonadota bacterium]
MKRFLFISVALCCLFGMAQAMPPLQVTQSIVDISYRTPVVSSAIASIGYKDNVLEIEFNSGKVYQYQDINFVLYLNFINADSKGKFYNKYIKGNYAAIRIK